MASLARGCGRDGTPPWATIRRRQGRHPERFQTVRKWSRWKAQKRYRAYKGARIETRKASSSKQPTTATWLATIAADIAAYRSAFRFRLTPLLPGDGGPLSLVGSYDQQFLLGDLPSLTARCAAAIGVSGAKKRTTFRVTDPLRLCPGWPASQCVVREIESLFRGAGREIARTPTRNAFRSGCPCEVMPCLTPSFL